MAGSNDRRRKLSKRRTKKLQEGLNLSGDEIESLSEEELAWAENKLEVADRPGARLDFELDAHCGDDGEIPADSRSRAMEQVATMRAGARTFSTEVAGVPTGSNLFSIDARLDGPTAGLTATAGWTAHGPGNIGGRTRAIVIDPTNNARIYAASAGGGVWRSTDSGASWIPLDDMMANLAVCALVMDPTDNNTLFAGTGEGFGNSDAIRGDGIFRSTDGGQTWTQLAATTTNPDFFFVNSLAITPDGQTLLAATGEGVFRSTDAGQTWTRVSTITMGNLQLDPNDETRAVAGGMRNGRAYFSTDGGASWTAATRPETGGRRIQVCYASADTATVYASVEATPSKLWRSTDGGHSYSSRNATSGGLAANFLSRQGWYDNIIWAGDPTDKNLVIVGGVDLWRSTNGGTTLNPISTWYDDDSVHADHHAIVADPNYDGTTNRRVYFGNDGGVYRTDDVTTAGNNTQAPFTNGWENLNNGYAVTQFFYGDGHIGTNTIIAGAQDNGTLRYTPAQGVSGWNEVFGGDGGDVASDPADPMIWYGEYVYLQIFRDTSGGLGARFPDDYICGRYWDGAWKWKPAPFTIADARDQTALFIAPFELDPNDPETLLGGGSSLWRTNDARTANSVNPPSGPSWATIKDPIGTNPRLHSITAIAIAPGDSDIVVVGHANGHVYRSNDATAAIPTWERIDTNGIGASRQCLAVTIDPDDHGVIYASFGGYEPDNLWVTRDSGQSWTDLSAGLPDAPIRDVTLHPQRSTWIYLATEIGVFASEDGGQSWSPTNEGPANVSCRDLFWMGSRLVVVTHGRGTFEIDLLISDPFPLPHIEHAGSEAVTIEGSPFTRHRLSVTNRVDYPSSLFLASPDLPPCGQVTAASRTWIDIHNGDNDQRLAGFCALSSIDDLDDLWFNVPQGAAGPGSVYIVLRDRRCITTLRSNTVVVAAPGTPNKFADDGTVPATRFKFIDDIQTSDKFADDGGPNTRFKFIDDSGPNTRFKFLDDGFPQSHKATGDASQAVSPLPFSLATPHHAPTPARVDRGELEHAIAELDEYVYQLDAMLRHGGGHNYAAIHTEYLSAVAQLQQALALYHEQQ